MDSEFFAICFPQGGLRYVGRLASRHLQLIDTQGVMSGGLDGFSLEVSFARAIQRIGENRYQYLPIGFQDCPLRANVSQN